MARLYFDEVTVKTYRKIRKSESYFKIKGKRYKETEKKSILLTKQLIDDSRKVAEELKNVFYEEYG